MFSDPRCVCVVAHGVIRRVECRQKCRPIFLLKCPPQRHAGKLGKTGSIPPPAPFTKPYTSLSHSLDHSLSLQEHGYTAQPCCPGDRCQATATGEEGWTAGSSQCVPNGMDWVCIINTVTDLELHEYSASVAFPQLNLDTHTHTPKQLSRSQQDLFLQVTEGRAPN